MKIFEGWKDASRNVLTLQVVSMVPCKDSKHKWVLTNTLTVVAPVSWCIIRLSLADYRDVAVAKLLNPILKRLDLGPVELEML